VVFFMEFADPAHEQEFQKAYLKNLPRQVCILSCAILIVVPYCAICTPQNAYFEFRALTAGVTCSMWFVVLLISWLRRRNPRISHISEALAISALIETLLVCALWNDVRIGTLLNSQQHLEKGNDAIDQREALSLGTFILTIVMINLMIAIRWHRLILMNVLTVFWCHFAVCQLGSAMDANSQEVFLTWLSIGALLASFLAWKKEMQFRARWKTVKRMEYHNQALRDLMSTVFEYDCVATEEFVLGTNSSQTLDKLGDVSGKKLQDLVTPECADTLTSILAPVQKQEFTTRVVMTPPLTVRSNSSVAVGVTLNVVMVVADAGEVCLKGECSWRYLVGFKDLQEVTSSKPNHEMRAEEKHDVLMCESRVYRSDCRLLDQQSDCSYCSTPRTAVVFSQLSRSSTNHLNDKTFWEALADLGEKEHWLIPAEDVDQSTEGALLGRGGFGSVREGLLHGSPVALKDPHYIEATDLQRATVALANELRVLRRLRHPNVVILHGACINPNKMSLSLIFEKIDGETLNCYLASKRVDKHANSRYHVLENVSCALRYLHEQSPRIVHSDLKDTNVMVEMWEGRPRARLLDFGLSRLATPSSSLVGGSWRWAAPELFKRTKTAKPSSDVFSFGRVLHCVLTGQMPLTGVRERATAQLFFNQGIVWTPCWYEQTLLSQRARILSQKCLKVCEADRPSSKYIHDYIQKMLKYSSEQPMYTPRNPCDMLSFSIGVDVLEDKMPILWSSSLPAVLGKATIHENLLDMAVQPHIVSHWIQLHVQLIADSNMRKDVMQTQFSFRLPLASGAFVEMCAICVPKDWSEPEMEICMQDVRIIDTLARVDESSHLGRNDRPQKDPTCAQPAHG